MKRKPKTPCKRHYPDVMTRKSYIHAGSNAITDTYRCERCGKVIVYQDKKWTTNPR